MRTIDRMVAMDEAYRAGIVLRDGVCVVCGLPTIGHNNVSACVLALKDKVVELEKALARRARRRKHETLQVRAASF